MQPPRLDEHRPLETSRAGSGRGTARAPARTPAATGVSAGKHFASTTTGVSPRGAQRLLQPQPGRVGEDRRRVRRRAPRRRRRRRSRPTSAQRRAAAAAPAGRCRDGPGSRSSRTTGWPPRPEFRVTMPSSGGDRSVNGATARCGGARRSAPRASPSPSRTSSGASIPGTTYVAVRGEAHLRPLLPVRDRRLDQHRARRRRHDLAAGALVHADPRVEVRAVVAAPLHVALDRDQRIALLQRRAHRRDHGREAARRPPRDAPRRSAARRHRSPRRAGSTLIASSDRTFPPPRSIPRSNASSQPAAARRVDVHAAARAPRRRARRRRAAPAGTSGNSS